MNGAGDGGATAAVTPSRLRPHPVTRLIPSLIAVLLVLPVGGGLAFVALPAFGYLPALGSEHLTLAPFAALLDTPGLARMLWLSLGSGLVSAALATGAVILFLASAYGRPQLALMRRVLSPLLALPHAAAALGFAVLAAPSGLVARALSPWLTGWERPPDLLIIGDPYGLAMIAGLTAKEIPFLLLMSLAALPQLEPERRLAVARSLGYGPVTAFLKAVLPALYPLIRLPVYAVIAFASSVVDVALILGPSTPPTLAVHVLRLANDPDLSLRFAASAAALLQLGATVAALLVWRSGELLLARLARPALTSGRRRHADGLLTALGLAGTLGAAAALAAGLGALVLWSVAGPWRFPDLLPSAFTLQNWSVALTSAGGPVGEAALIAVAAGLAALLLAVAWLEAQTRAQTRAGGQGWKNANAGAEAILYLPLIVPAVAFLFGLVLLQIAAGLDPGRNAVTFGHILLVLPYVFLSLAGPWRRLDPRWAMLAASLGAAPARVLLAVRLPLLAAPLLTATAVGLAVSLGQYLPTQLLGAGRVQTVTTEAVSLAAGGDRRVAAVWGLLQAALPAGGFLLATALPAMLFRHRRGMGGRM